METVNKVIDSASSTIWGQPSTEQEQQEVQHGDEPLSGIQGQGTATDPYDAGNREDQSTEPLLSSPSDLTPTRTPTSTSMVEEAKPTRSDPSPGPASGGSADREEAKVAAAAQSSSSEDDYEAEPEVKVSQEALRGPKAPEPRPEYEFEKEMDGKPSAKTSHHEHPATRGEDHHSHGAHFPRSMSKWKDRVIGRAAKAGNHLHSTNR